MRKIFRNEHKYPKLVAAICAKRDACNYLSRLSHGFATVFLALLLGYLPAHAEDTALNLSKPKPQQHRENLLVLGDSLSAAYQMRPEQGWVALLQQRLSSEGFNIHVVNASVSGATTAAGLQQLPIALKKYRPKWVIIELGGNDGLQGKPVPYIKGNLNTLIQQSKRSNATAILMGIRLPPNYGSAYIEPFFNMYSELAAQHNIAYRPFMLDRLAQQIVQNKRDDLMMSDGIHPKASAQTLILESVWETVRPVLPRTTAETQTTLKPSRVPL